MSQSINSSGIVSINCIVICINLKTLSMCVLLKPLKMNGFLKTIRFYIYGNRNKICCRLVMTVNYILVLNM